MRHCSLDTEGGRKRISFSLMSSSVRPSRRSRVCVREKILWKGRERERDCGRREGYIQRESERCHLDISRKCRKKGIQTKVDKGVVWDTQLKASP